MERETGRRRKRETEEQLEKGKEGEEERGPRLGIEQEREEESRRKRGRIARRRKRTGGEKPGRLAVERWSLGELREKAAKESGVGTDMRKTENDL